MAVTENLYDVLGVAPGADQRDIKKAYFAKVRQFPPETHPAEFAKLREAYDVLGTPEGRKQYDASRGEAFAELGPELAAEMRAAVASMAAEDWAHAVTLLQAVLAQQPDAEEARGRLCACLLSLKRFADAEQQARELVSRHPSKPQSHLFLGYALRDQERHQDARAAFLEAAKLAPADFRPVRAVVDMELALKRAEAALGFVDGRLREAADASMTLALRMERIALLHHTLAWAKADQELDAARADVERLDQQEDLAFFLEREGAVLLAQNKHGRAEQVLARLAALAPSRETSALTSHAVVRLSELPEASVAWLQAQKKTPEILCLPRAGLFSDSLLFLVALASFGLPALVALSSDSEWTGAGAVFGGGLLGGAGVFAAWAGLRWWRHLHSKVGRFVAVHPLYLVEMDLDEVQLWPLVALSRIAATHHHTNGVYTHTQFNLSFGPKVRSLSVRPQALGNQFGDVLQAIRNRLLDLLHGGMLAAERGADFVPAELMRRRRPPRDLRRLKVLAAGAALGALVALAGAVMGQRTQEDTEWLSAQADASPEAVRRYLGRHPGGRYAEAGAQLLASRRAKVLEQLGASAPEMAALLAKAPSEQALGVPVRFTGTATAPAFKPPAPKGWALVGPPERELGPARRMERERQLLAALQQRLDQRLGAGWFQLYQAPADRAGAVSVEYELSFSGRVYSAKSGAGDDVGTALWPAPRITAKATLGGAQRQLTVEPPKSLPVHGQAARQLASDADAAWEPVLQQLWLGFGERLGALLGAG